MHTRKASATTFSCSPDARRTYAHGAIEQSHQPGLASDVTPRDLTPGDYDAPVFSLGGQDDYAFSPDGQEICYASNHDKNPAASTNNDLWIVPVNVGRVAQVLAQETSPPTIPPATRRRSIHPMARYIAYRAQQRPGYESDRFRLMLYDRKTGEKKNLTEDFDQLGGNLYLGARFEALYFAARSKGDIADLRSRLIATGDIKQSP